MQNLMWSFFLNKQQNQNSGKQDSSKRSLDKVKENEHTKLLEKNELNKIEGGASNQSGEGLRDRLSLDDFFSGPIPQ